MTKQEILQQVADSDWQPVFEFTDDLDAVVDSILKPHEDYFLGLHSKVKEIIEREIKYFSDYHRQCVAVGEAEQSYYCDNNYKITFSDVCHWQKELFEHKKNLIGVAISTLDVKNLVENHQNIFAIKAGCLPNQHINLGLRSVNVKVGSWYPPHPMFLEDLKEMCFPVIADEVKVTNEEVLDALTNWYKTFQTIHFFEDLNGRIGGIVINILSYLLTDKYLINIDYKSNES